MEKLIHFFDAVDRLSPESKILMREHLKMGSFKKGEFFFERGRVCTQLGFVTEGVFRVYQCTPEGEEVTSYFTTEGHFAVDLESFNSGSSGRECIEALTDCTVVLISRKSFDVFALYIPNWMHIIHKLTEKALLEKLRIRSEMISDDAATRYEKLLQRNPYIVQRVSSGVISSYLGISPFTLSRIRKQLV